ncbi:MAG: lasso RiPP family leader peptide-containing protein [Acidimicrobiia bacterium]
MVYEPPEIKALGSVEELTFQFDKIGATMDAFSPALDGSIVPD